MPPRTTAPLKQLPKHYKLLGPMANQKTEEIEDLFIRIWKNTGVLVEAANSFSTALAAGDIGAPGNDTNVVFNRKGLLHANQDFKWSYDDFVLRLAGSTAPANGISLNVGTFSGYSDIALQASIQDGGSYIPYDDAFAYFWSFSFGNSSGWEFMWDETAGVASSFTKGMGWSINSPLNASDTGFNVYQYGGLGATETGMGVIVNNNTDGSGAAGYFAAFNKSGAVRYFWPDANHFWRFHTAAPKADGSVSDTIVSTGSLAALHVQAEAAGRVAWFSRSRMTSPSDGNILLTNDAATAFSLLQLGGTSSSFPALKRSSAEMHVRLADDTAFATLRANLNADDLATGTVPDARIPQAVPTEQTTTSTGTQNDFSLSARYTLLRVNNASAVTFTGFTIGGNTPTANDRVIIINVGTSTVRVADNDGGSTAANQATFPSTRGQILGAGGTLTLAYDTTTDRWRPVAVEPGTPIPVPFNAGDYTAGGAGTWTVASGDVLTFSYAQTGKRVLVTLSLTTTTVGGVPNNQLFVLLPNSFTAVGAPFNTMVAQDNGTVLGGYFNLGGGTQIQATRIDNVAWAVAANTTGMFGSIEFEVT